MKRNKRNTDMTQFGIYIGLVEEENRRRIKAIKRHYEAGKNDCKNGFYDKWYRYNTINDGRAYDLGWQEQNQITQNETVQFIEA